MSEIDFDEEICKRINKALAPIVERITALEQAGGEIPEEVKHSLLVLLEWFKQVLGIDQT